MIDMSLLVPRHQDNRFYGVTVGIVTNDEDPDGLGRVKVKFPWLSETEESAWARIAAPIAGKEWGFFCLPKVDEEVLVAFEHGQINLPYVLGLLWNGQDKPPKPSKDKLVIQSRSGHLICWDDNDQDAKLSIQDSSGKNKIVLSTQDNAIYITSDADVTIQANHGTLKLSGQDVEIKAQGGIKIEAQQNCDIKANAQANLQAKAGMAIHCMAGVKINDGALEVM